jgi:Necrosis inducing protein (NPP1)
MISYRKICASIVFSIGSSLFGSNLAQAAYTPKEIKYSDVQPFGENAESWQYTWKPLLKLLRTCHPYPAVQKNGDWSGGATSKSQSCSDNKKGQIYSRYKKYTGRGENNRCALMFAWYFPRDAGVEGHTHDWETVILWLKECDDGKPAPIGVSYSQHGDFLIREGTKYSGWVRKHVKVKYQQGSVLGGLLPVINAELNPTDDEGGSQPLIGWNQLTPAARKSLNTADFGKANVPFNDSNFEKTLKEAMPKYFFSAP